MDSRFNKNAELLLPKSSFRKQEEGDQEGWVVAYADMITLLFIFFTLLLSISSVSTTKLDLIRTQWNQKTSSSLAQIAEEIKAQIAKNDLSKMVSMEYSDEGLRVAFNEKVLFPSGTAELNAEGHKVLTDLAVTLKNMKSKYQVAIEGHTDDLPIHNQSFSSNWSLASARAVNVLHFLSENGVSDRTMSVRGFADTRPLGDSAGADKSRQRRVSILIY